MTNGLSLLLLPMACVLAGAGAAFAVAQEIGGRAGLPFLGRMALAGALGLGVFSVGAKLALIVLFSQLDLHAGPSGWPGPSSPPEARSIEAEHPPAVANPPETLGWRVWLALPEEPPWPGGARPSRETIELGRRLFEDTRLSGDGTLSCSTCHDLARGGDDGRTVSRGIGGRRGNRNAPGILTAAHLTHLFWDGRATSLEEQAFGPLLNPVEMGMPSTTAIEARIADDPDYTRAFRQIFGADNPVVMANIVAAISAYERTLPIADTPYDRFARGDDTALTGRQIAGMMLFDEIGCRSCHIDPVFSSAGSTRPLGGFRRFPVHRDNRYLDTYDLLVDGQSALWRVPSLRDVARTAPYFHNGSVSSLEEAIRIMAVSQLGLSISTDPSTTPDIRAIARTSIKGERGVLLLREPGHALTEAEISDIAAFLRALSPDGICSSERGRPDCD